MIYCTVMALYVVIVLGFLGIVTHTHSFPRMDEEESMKAWTPIFKEPPRTSSVSGAGNLTLDNIREALIRLEDSIIFSLIERAQYSKNLPTYDPTRFEISGFKGSLVDYLLKETEHVHAKVRRYLSPDEHPYFPQGLPPPLLPPLEYPQVLHSAGELININPEIRKVYFDNLLPKFVHGGDDGNYGSTALCDIQCLQVMSKRIHYGKFVAEVKYRDSPGLFKAAIQERDTETLMRLITDAAVEASVERRVVKKAMSYGKEIDAGATPRYKIEPEFVGRLYTDWIIPLTKKVEVEYLLSRRE